MSNIKKKVEFILPWGPSVNERLGHNKKNKRMYLSAAFKNYFKIAQAAIRKQLKFKNKKITEKINQIMIFHAPDKRKRDSDNYPKAVNDAIKHAGVIEDDSLLQLSLIGWGEPVEGGRVNIKLGNFKFKAVYEDGTTEEI